MLAFALNDPAFGILYVSLVAVLTAGLVFGARLPLSAVRAIQLLAAAGLGFLLCLALRANRTDLSGDAPLKLGRVPLPAPLSPLVRTELRTGPIDLEISVELFDVDSTATPGLHPGLTIHSGYAVLVGGWAYDPRMGAPCSAVDVAFDDRLHASVTYGIPRPDVAAFFHDDRHTMTGFSALIPTQGLAPGTHTVRVRCIESPNELALPAVRTLTLRIIATR